MTKLTDMVWKIICLQMLVQIEGRELFQKVRRIISDVETAIWLSDEIEIKEKMIRYIDELKSLS